MSTSPKRPIRTQAETELSTEKFRLGRDITKLLTWPLRLLALYPTARVAERIVEALSGEETAVSLLFDFSFVLSGTFVLGSGGFLLWKLRHQSKDLQRARSRITWLEGELRRHGIKVNDGR